MLSSNNSTAKKKMSKEYYYTKNKDGFMGSENRKVRKKKPETCEQQLRRMCKNIAESISSPGDGDTAHDWMEGTYDIRYLVDREKRYMAAEILVAGGGPTMWVDTWENEVKGYWGSDRVTVPFADNLGLNDYCEEMYGY